MADNKKPGYQYSIFDQIESDKKLQSGVNKIRAQKQEYQDAIERLQKELDGLSNDTPEDRNEYNSIQKDIRFYKERIEALNNKLKQYLQK